VDQSQIAFELIISQEATENLNDQAPVVEEAAPQDIPAQDSVTTDVPAELGEDAATPQVVPQGVPVEPTEDGSETVAPTPRAQDNTAREGAPTRQQPANPQQGTPPAAPQPVQENAGPRITVTQQAAPEPTTPVVTTSAPGGESTPSQPAAAQSTPQPVPTTPVVATAPVIAQSAPVSEPASVASAPPANTPAGMLEQVRGPIGRLTQAGAGEHTFTVNVTPENLGPVTVRAHIGHESIRVELIGATDGARESLRAILNDLKRDLQSTGMNAQLDVGSERSDARDQFGPGGFGRGTASPSAAQAGAGNAQFVENDATPSQDTRHPDAHGVDIMA
jgi:flagellar hook-length control protein FliK